MTDEKTRFSRRGFLGLLGLGAAAVVVAPERRFWQVGTSLVAPTAEETLALAAPRSGLVPIEGQPGLFRDLATGKVLNIRDFTESDKYDTICIPAPREDTVRFFSEPLPRSLKMMAPMEGQPGLFRDVDTGQILNIRDF